MKLTQENLKVFETTLEKRITGHFFNHNIYRSCKGLFVTVLPYLKDLFSTLIVRLVLTMMKMLTKYRRKFNKS